MLHYYNYVILEENDERVHCATYEIIDGMYSLITSVFVSAWFLENSNPLPSPVLNNATLARELWFTVY